MGAGVGATYLECSGTYVVLCIGQKSQNCTPKRLNFTLYKLHLHKSDLTLKKDKKMV